jgi:hypothetical protein
VSGGHRRHGESALRASGNGHRDHDGGTDVHRGGQPVHTGLDHGGSAVLHTALVRYVERIDPVLRSIGRDVLKRHGLLR